MILGSFVSRAHIVGHVKDIGHSVDRPITRVYATPLSQPWHNDSVISPEKNALSGVVLKPFIRLFFRVSAKLTVASRIP